MSSEATPESVYRTVWRDQVESDKKLDPEKVKEVLFDYAALLYNLRILYGYLTDQVITHPLTPVTKIIEMNDQIVADSLDEAVLEVLSGILDEFKGANGELEALQEIQSHVARIYDRMVTGDNN